MELKDLEIYQISLVISGDAWLIYDKFDWQTKKVIGDQWVSCIDSIGANVAEGFGRFHYLDKNKFNYNARGSLLEATHWTKLLHQRKLISDKDLHYFFPVLEQLLKKLNSYLKNTKNMADNK